MGIVPSTFTRNDPSLKSAKQGILPNILGTRMHHLLVKLENEKPWKAPGKMYQDLFAGAMFFIFVGGCTWCTPPKFDEWNLKR